MARKRFGQHFLHEAGVIRRIIAAIAAGPGDRLIEIGPGRGALTDPLLAAADALTVIEIDRELAFSLRATAASRPGLTVIEADALTVDYGAIASACSGRALRLVGNLPYNISSPLLFHLLASSASILDMHFMLQKEVVDRMTAAPGSRTYGRLSVSVAARAQATALFDVAPGAFTPPPRVMSAVVRIRPRAPAFTIDDSAWFDQIVTAAFGKRRKTLANALRAYLDSAAIKACDVDPGERAERLHAADFARLANAAAAIRR